jgi:DNA-binding transcriptional ArsR family regulator
LQLLDAVRDGLRLRILLALEDEPRSATELSAALGQPYGKVNWAVKSLIAAGIVEVQENRRELKTVSIVLTTPYVGWSGLAAELDRLAGSAENT